MQTSEVHSKFWPPFGQSDDCPHSESKVDQNCQFADNMTEKAFIFNCDIIGYAL